MRHYASKYTDDVIPKSQRIATLLMIIAIIAIGIHLLTNIWITLAATLFVPMNILSAKAARRISHNWSMNNVDNNIGC
ncbi:MAG: hypothetical protein PHF35_02525 [Candidatus Moranbacteria bacterium]|nr:hypothetical protein [Candidatus Moranbacteria bacterium]